MSLTKKTKGNLIKQCHFPHVVVAGLQRWFPMKRTSQYSQPCVALNCLPHRLTLSSRIQWNQSCAISSLEPQEGLVASLFCSREPWAAIYMKQEVQLPCRRDDVERPGRVAIWRGRGPEEDWDPSQAVPSCPQLSSFPADSANICMEKLPGMFQLKQTAHGTEMTTAAVSCVNSWPTELWVMGK